MWNFNEQIKTNDIEEICAILNLYKDKWLIVGNEIAVLSGNGKDGFLKVVTGDDNKVYIEFLDDNGINSIKPGALITSFDDIEEALA